jgi:RNA polymerase sigma-70 factor, ECF subfamily
VGQRKMSSLSERQDKRSDQDLVSASLENRNKFVDIVLRYQKPIRRYVIRLGCRNSDDVEDLLQEIFIKLYLNLNEYDPDLKFSSWLYRIAHNETINFFRKRSIRQAPMVGEEGLRLLNNIIGGVDSIYVLHRKSDAELLQKAISQLKEQHSSILILKFLEEKSYIEISDILKLPIGTVGSLINRAKNHLRNILLTKKYKDL